MMHMLNAYEDKTRHNGRQSRLNSLSEDKVGSYQQTTDEITVSVESFYLDDQSEPEEHHYVWAYRVRIENNGEETVQILSRHWHITDSMGNMQEVQGDGVVGEQPILAPGDFFEYTSGTPLSTPSGIMVGTYDVKSNQGRRFAIGIPAFSLDSPHQAVQIN